MLLSQDHGEGRLTYRALRAGGFDEISAIAGSPVRAIADRGHFSMQTAQRLKTGAREMMRKGLGGQPSRGPARVSKPDAAPVRTRRFSDGITRQEALTLQRAESRPPDVIPDEEPRPFEPETPASPESTAHEGTFWSFG